jgi:hypothetical protein
VPLIVQAGSTSFQLDVRTIQPSGRPAAADSDGMNGPLSPAELYRALAEQRDIRQVLRRLAVDTELREVSEQFEATLRTRRPELFDRRGRLRATAVTRLLTDRVGGTQTLSGEVLRRLEEEAETKSATPPDGAS